MQQFVWGYRGPNIGPTDTNKSDCFVYQPIPLGCELLKKGSSAHSYNSFLILAVTTAQVLGKLFIILIQSINLSLCKVERRGSGLDSGLGNWIAQTPRSCIKIQESKKDLWFPSVGEQLFLKNLPLKYKSVHLLVHLDFYWMAEWLHLFDKRLSSKDLKNYSFLGVPYRQYVAGSRSEHLEIWRESEIWPECECNQMTRFDCRIQDLSILKSNERVNAIKSNLGRTKSRWSRFHQGGALHYE